MRNGIFMTGLLVVVSGFLLAAVLYPGVGFSTAGETADEIGGLMASGSTNGAPVKFRGVVAEDFTDINESLAAYAVVSVIFVEDLELDGIPILILSDNARIQPGDEVTVEGYAHGIGWSWFIAGSSVEEVRSSGSLDPADVEKVPHKGFYVGIVVAVVGIILMMAGGVMTTKRR